MIQAFVESFNLELKESKLSPIAVSLLTKITMNVILSHAGFFKMLIFRLRTGSLTFYILGHTQERTHKTTYFTVPVGKGRAFPVFPASWRGQ